MGLSADPQSFGMSEVRQALHERGLAYVNLDARIRPGATPAEGFAISGHLVVAMISAD